MYIFLYILINKEQENNDYFFHWKFSVVIDCLKNNVFNVSRVIFFYIFHYIVWKKCLKLFQIINLNIFLKKSKREILIRDKMKKFWCRIWHNHLHSLQKHMIIDKFSLQTDVHDRWTQNTKDFEEWKYILH